MPVRVNRPATAYEETERAIRVARAERRAVLLNLPLDVANRDAEWPQDAPAGALPAAPAPSPAAVAEVVAAIAAAQRPVIVAGRGAVLAGAREALVDLSERDRRAAGDVGDGPRDLQRPPILARDQRRVRLPARGRDHRRQSDLILAFGARLTRWTTANGALVAPGTRVVQVDLDESGFGDRADLTVLGDAPHTAAAVVGRARPRRRPAQRPPRRRPPRAHRRPPLARRALRRRLDRAPRRPPRAEHRARRPAAEGAHGRRRLRALHGLPGDVPRRARPGGLRLHPVVPVDRPRPGERDRRRARAPRPPDRRRARRRRRDDGRCPSSRPPRACACRSCS